MRKSYSNVRKISNVITQSVAVGNYIGPLAREFSDLPMFEVNDHMDFEEFLRNIDEYMVSDCIYGEQPVSTNPPTTGGRRRRRRRRRRGLDELFD